MEEGTPTSDGAGRRVVLVHGAVTGGVATWEAQQPLARDFELLTPDRSGYDVDGPDAPDDPEADADAIAAALGTGAHLVGYSAGGLVAMLAAARNPERVRSLVLIEPVVFDLVRGRADVETFISRYEELQSGSADAERFLRDFLLFFGADPEEVAQIPDPMPDALRKAAVAQFTGAAPWQVRAPVTELAGAPFPIVVVSGGHSEMFEAACDAVADAVGARRTTISGAGHAVQFTGDPFNALLRATWAPETTG